MSTPVVAFYNTKGGVGRTSMVYHLAWMLSEMGVRVIAADLDPQANLTATFVDEDRLEQTMPNKGCRLTIFGAVQPLKQGTGDIAEAHVEPISESLGLILGDMGLSTFEDDLSDVWPKCLAGDPRAFKIMSAFWRVVQAAAEKRGAHVILVDLGPNLGAISRAALIAADFVVIPMGPDLFSLQGLQNLGPALQSWRDGWQERLGENPPRGLPLPPGSIRPVGYIVRRNSIRLDRPVGAYERWIARIPSTYADAVLQEPADPHVTIDKDANCIARLKDFSSLIPLAREARKPMFFLKPADGALGAYTHAVAEAHRDYRALAKEILARANLGIPDAG